MRERGEDMEKERVRWGRGGGMRGGRTKRGSPGRERRIWMR